MAVLTDVRAFGRYARRLQAFLDAPLPEPEARAMISQGLARRETEFLVLLKTAVFDRGRSPYARLFAHAGIELGDVAAMVSTDGIESTLRRLHEQGVWLDLAEAKGQKPVTRGALEFTIAPHELHNTLISRDFEGTTGGSRSATRFWIDLDDVRHASAYFAVARNSQGIERSQGTIWLPAPPSPSGIRRALWWSKAGMDVRRWFAQIVPQWRPGQFKRAAFVRWNGWASRRAGRPLPAPERTPPEEAARVARWLSAAATTGEPEVLFCTPSSAVRVCAAAGEAGLPLAGTFFSMGGEPYTPAKAQAIADAGCRADIGYFMAEMGGPLAVACPHAAEVDAAHVAADRVALIDVERLLSGGARIPALYATTVSPRAPQVAINVETGDYATWGERRCGCSFERLGLTQTIHSIRSYEKLTTEGMHFFGPRLMTLLEEELPRRFGGGPTDYQLVEEEDSRGRSRISLVVSPRVPAVDEHRIVEVALSFLSAGGVAEHMMAEIWNLGGTLRVQRRQPVVSGASKVLPLHVLRGS